MTRGQGRTATNSPRSNAELARDLWVATSKGDGDGIRRLLDPDIVWHTYSRGALSGSVQGANAVLDLFARTGELVDELSNELIDIYASADGAVTHFRIHAERGPHCLDGEVLLLMRMREGRVFEASSTPIDARESDRFWLSH